MPRTLFLLAYDVRDPSRLRRVHNYLIGYRVDGQKSVFEIWVTAAELRKIQSDLLSLIDPDNDRLHIIALDPRLEPVCVGQATHFKQTYFSIV